MGCCFINCYLYITECSRYRCCHSDFSTMKCIICLHIYICTAIYTAYNMASFNRYLYVICVIAIVVKVNAFDFFYIFFMSVYKLQLLIFKYTCKKIQGILRTKTNTCASPFGIEHSKSCFYIIISPESVTGFKCRECPVWFCIVKPHLFHIMSAIILHNAP